MNRSSAKPAGRYEGGDYLAANPSWHEEDSAWKARKILQLLRRAGVSLPPTVAEVGCGAGGILKRLQEATAEPAEFFGYDVAPAAIERAMRHANARLSFHCEDILRAGRRFDLLLCIDVFEHVEDPFAFLRSMRALAPLFVFNIPLEMHVAGILINHQLWTRRQFGHLHYYTAPLAMETLNDCGYRIVARDYPSRLLDEPRSASEWIFWLPRKVGAMISPEFSARVFGGTSLLVLARPEGPGA
ncbi:MAG TPA: class I SAM-dependent methyltransferase [Burkholderiales bacterium]|nr:class I SAM-dependent methyltransferase [Burkholderiales bacterium]